MRIISGTYKNRKIEFTKLKSRPTTDFAKESLFNILQNSYNFDKKIVLDLFAGTGNISYEFISRGAKKTIAIDSSLACCNFMNKMKEKLEMFNFEIHYSTAIKFLYHTKCQFDIIFIDPPFIFSQEKYDEILKIIYKKKTINNAGSIIIEHSNLITFSNHIGFIEERRYGRVHFSFLKP